MKKNNYLLLFLLGAFLLTASACHPDLNDFCGETPVNAYTKGSHEYFLSFPKKDGAGLTTVPVSQAEYEYYGLTRPIDCK